MYIIHNLLTVFDQLNDIGHALDENRVSVTGRFNLLNRTSQLRSMDISYPFSLVNERAAEVDRKKVGIFSIIFLSAYYGF